MRSFRSITAQWSRIGFILLFISLNLSQGSIADSSPWRVKNNLLLPEWLSISGQQRARYETLDEQFRVGGNGDDQILVLRTNLLLELVAKRWKFGLEILDARQSYGKDNTPINTSVVNPIDVLQLYMQWQVDDLFAQHSLASLRAGRFTIDVGSRRFVARNLFRNTINAFTGVDWQWASEKGNKAHIFFTLPTNRLPNERTRLVENRSQGDDQDTAVKFWGLCYHLANDWPSKAELFYFGLNENDSHNRPTRNRDLHTFGGRIYKQPARGKFDYQFESAWQFGKSRFTSAPMDRDDLDHFAHFYHLEVGYEYATKWSPRISAQFDFASGDNDPDDNENNRFDTLFGARRFDFGPTGIFGPFARANIVTPGVRLQLRPSSNTSLLFGHRAYWLASKRDAWTVANLRDTGGDSGRFIGQQFEWRIRWEVLPRNVRLELGGAYLFKGKFANRAPNATAEGDPNYLYGQVLLSF